MARRRNRSNIAELGMLVLLAIPVLVSIAIYNRLGALGTIFAVLLVAAGVSLYLIRKKAKRLEYLRAKYRDEKVVTAILGRKFWQGQTAGQLRDSLGAPPSADYNLLKTRKREIWKYHPAGINRYRLRITLDNDVVVSWEQWN